MMGRKKSKIFVSMIVKKSPLQAKRYALFAAAIVIYEIFRPDQWISAWYSCRDLTPVCWPYL